MMMDACLIIWGMMSCSANAQLPNHPVKGIYRCVYLGIQSETRRESSRRPQGPSHVRAWGQ